MISDKKALACMETLAQFCKEQPSCQNCIFREHSTSRWECYASVGTFEYREVADNIEAKKRNHGYL